MKLSLKAHTPHIVAAAILVLGFVVFALAPFALCRNQTEAGMRFANSFKEDDIFTSTGGPSDSVVHAVQQAQGLFLTLLVVDRLSLTAESRFKNQNSNEQWRKLATQSLIGVDSNEWPLTFYKNVPLLNLVWSPPGALDCVNALKSGKHCDI